MIHLLIKLKNIDRKIFGNRSLSCHFFERGNRLAINAIGCELL